MLKKINAETEHANSIIEVDLLKYIPLWKPCFISDTEFLRPSFFRSFMYLLPASEPPDILVIYFRHIRTPIIRYATARLLIDITLFDSKILFNWIVIEESYCQRYWVFHSIQCKT